MKDIFELQDEITLSVIDALKLKLFGDGKAAVLKRYTENAATATVRETSHGEVVIDYFHLLKVEDRWWIVSKLWDAEPENR